MKRYVFIKDSGTDVMNNLKEDGSLDHVSLGFTHIDVFFPNGAVYDTQNIEAAGLTRHFESLIHYGRATDSDDAPEVKRAYIKKQDK
jgi:hypothetical protein